LRKWIDLKPIPTGSIRLAIRRLDERTRQISVRRVRGKLSQVANMRSTSPMPQRTESQSDAPSGVSASDMVSVPGMPVFVMNDGKLLPVKGYAYMNNRLTCMLVSGGRSIIGSDEVDWPATIRLNAKRGVRVTLRAAPQTTQSSSTEQTF